MSSPAQRPRAPLLWLLLPLMAGLTAAKIWPPPAAGLFPLVIAAIAVGALALWLATTDRRGTNAGWGCTLFLAGGFGGFVFLQFRQPQLHLQENRPPREVTVTVQVSQTFPAAPNSRSLAGLGEIVGTSEREPELMGRRLYYSVIRKISILPVRSGRYQIRGVIETVSPDPQGDGFNDYLDNLGIHQKLSRGHILREVAPPNRFALFCHQAQQKLEGILRHGLEAYPATASLYVAMLLGGKASLSPDQQNAFMRSGTFHVFSVSGLHIGVIALSLQAILRFLRLPRRPALIICLPLLWLYVEITGGNTPALRALLMIAFFLAARDLRLPGKGLAALTASALVTLLLDPMQLFSTGFQMSYSVVAALLLMGSPLGEKWLAAWQPFAFLPKPDWRRYHHFVNWAGRKLLGAAAICVVAFLASTPSSIGYFQVFSTGSLLANLFIVPLASLAIMIGFVSLVAGLIGLAPLGLVLNSAAAGVIFSMDWLLEKTTNWPGVYFPAHFTSPWMAPASLVLLTTLMLAGSAHRWSPRRGGFWPPVLALALILIFGVSFHSSLS